MSSFDASTRPNSGLLGELFKFALSEWEELVLATLCLADYKKPPQCFKQSVEEKFQSALAELQDFPPALTRELSLQSLSLHLIKGKLDV